MNIDSEMIVIHKIANMLLLDRRRARRSIEENVENREVGNLCLKGLRPASGVFAFFLLDSSLQLQPTDGMPPCDLVFQYKRCLT